MASSSALITTLMIVLIVSIVIFVSGTQSENAVFCLMAMALGCAGLIAFALVENKRLGVSEEMVAGAAPQAAQRGARLNSWIMAMAYGWGGTLLLAGYGLAAISWRHDWQYGVGMVLIGLCLVGVRCLFAQNTPPSAIDDRNIAIAYRATQLQLAGAIAGLSFLVFSGKLASQKPDWPANAVFLFGGIAIAVLSVIAINTHRRFAGD